MSVQRALTGTSPTISHVFYGEDGEPAAVTSPTFSVKASDGTILVPTATATGPTSGAYTYRLPASATAQLDTLTATWTGTIGGVPEVFTDTIEIVGGFLFTLADARALPALADSAKYPDASVISARTLAEQAFEHIANVAFVPRYTVETVNGDGATRTLLMRWNRVRSVRSVNMTVGGRPRVTTALTSTELSGTYVSGPGTIGWDTPWPLGYGNIQVGYEHGYDSPPMRVAGAVLLLAKNFLVKGPVDDRAISQAGEFGNIALLTPGVRGAHFGIAEVEQALAEYGLPSGVA